MEMMTLTNATIMFAAFLISTVSVVIVFVAGITSGVVRMTTLLTRTLFAFFMAGAASYLALMIFDWYYEKQHKKFLSEVSDAESETPKDAEVNVSADANAQAETPQPAQSQQAEQPSFKPMDFGAK